jgi:Domain of unknown function (DUF4249)
MSMKKIKFVWLALLFFSCVRDVVIDLPVAKNALVLNNFLTADNLIYVRLTRVVNYVETPASLRTNLKNVEIDLYENNVFIERLTPAIIRENLWYAATIKAKKGVRYKITARADGFTPVEAEDKVPEEPVITDMRLSRIPFVKATAIFKLEDKAGEKNYYRLRFFKDSKPANSFAPMQLDMENLNVSNNDLLVDSFNENKYATWYFDDTRFEGKAVDIKFLANDNQSFINSDSVTYTCEVAQLTQSSYLYLKSSKAQNDNDVDEVFANLLEPVQVFTNVKNGYGIVGGIAISKLSVTGRN